MSHAIDLALMGLAATSQRWQLVALAVLLIVVRRWTFICKGLLALPAGWPWYAEPWKPTPALLALFPGMAKIVIMSSETSAGTGTEVVPNHPEPAGTGLVPPDTNAESTSTAPDSAAIARSATGHKIATEDLIALLAIHTDYSANKIADLVGGQRAAALAAVARHRKPLTTEPVARTLRRPENGW